MHMKQNSVLGHYCKTGKKNTISAQGCYRLTNSGRTFFHIVCTGLLRVIELELSCH